MALDGGLTPRSWRAEVTHVRRLTPGMVRVTLGGPGMTEDGTPGVGAEYVRVFVPHAGQNAIPSASSVPHELHHAIV